MAAKCPVCGAPMENNSCGYCGYKEETIPNSATVPPQPGQPFVQSQVIINNQNIPNSGVVPGVSKKNKMVALLLCIFLGVLGVHRFYVGKIGTGLLYHLDCGWLLQRSVRFAAASVRGGDYMGLLDAVKDQFLDVIEYVDQSNKLIVSKYQRESGNNELKQGSKVIVRESQNAVFLKGGKLADILPPGTYSLTTDNFPVLSSLKAFPYLFVSPVIADVYFVSTRQFIDNKWATKNPIMKRDKDFNMVRIRSFGKFAFRITDVSAFMREIFGTKGIVMTYDIVEYLSSMVTEAFSIVVAESEMSVLDLATEYRKLSGELQHRLNAQAAAMGVQFSDILIENISLPDEVEKLIDEQSGIGMAKQDMATFMQYQTARAMRDASKQRGGLAGLGAGMALGNTMAQGIQATVNPAASKSMVEQLRELKELLDEGILTQDEFDAQKKAILEKRS